MKITNILEIPFIWRLFRKIIDVFFGLYRKRMAVIREFGVTRKDSIIDIACGTGEYSQITDAEYLGVDLNNKYIGTARKVYTGKEFLCADANTAAIAEDSYAVALLIDATHHLSDPENKTLLKTLSRVASKYVIICDPIQQKKGNVIGRLLTRLDRGQFIRPEDNLLGLVKNELTIEKVARLKMMGVESICILAASKKSAL